MWEIITTDLFDDWFGALSDRDRANVLASMLVLRIEGPNLARPYSDTLKQSVVSNLKELRVQSGGKPIRVLYAFNKKRKAVILCGGIKSQNPKRFYKEIIPIAEHEFEKHIAVFKEDDSNG